MSTSLEDNGIYTLPKFHSSLAFSEDGKLALASSNLTGPTWNGTITIFNDAQFAPNIPHVDNAAVVESGPTDLEWVDKNIIVAATDAGNVEIWKINDTPDMDNTILLSEHNDICSSVSVSKESKQIVSGSWDGCIKIWDMEVDLSIHNIFYHTDKIYDVLWSQFSGEVFTSASEDGTIKLFDNRVAANKPGVLISNTPVEVPTCLAWKDDVQLLAGFDDGSIGLFDTRAFALISMFKLSHKNTVQSLCFSEDKVVSCSDDMSVKMHDINDFSCLYENAKHTDYVHDVAVNSIDGSIWSCAWDGLVLKHELK